jgi:uncharacterized membrane protein
VFPNTFTISQTAYEFSCGTRRRHKTKENEMSYLRSIAVTLAAAGSLVAASSMTASAAGPGMGSNLGDCYNIWVGWCNDHTSGYPSDCYGKSLDKCDQEHAKSSSAIPGATLKAMKTTSLRKAKPVRVGTPVKPQRSSN